MKKFLSLIAVAGMLSFYACGPSAEEKAAAEKAQQDSIAAAQAAEAESEAAKAQMMADSIANAEKAAADQMAADSAAKAAETKKK